MIMGSFLLLSCSRIIRKKGVWKHVERRLLLSKCFKVSLIYKIGIMPVSCDYTLLYQTFTCEWSPHSPLSLTGVGSLFPSPGYLPNPGIEPPRYPTLQSDSLLSEPPGKPLRAAVSYKPRSTSSSVQTGFVGFDGWRANIPLVLEWNWRSAHSLLNYSFWKAFCFISYFCYSIYFLIKILYKICKPGRATHRDSKDMGCQELFEGEGVPSERHMGMEYSLH